MHNSRYEPRNRPSFQPTIRVFRSFIIFLGGISLFATAPALGQPATPEEIACSENNASACNNAGLQYATGQGVDKDFIRSVELFTKACDNGVANGCSNAGIQYDNGWGVAEDQARATQLFLKGCDGDYAIACHFAGAQYDNGMGVAKDRARAAQLLEKACALGLKLSC
jgi:TPR repeat protein